MDDAMIRTTLGDLPAPVTLVSYTSDVESWYSRAERELLERVTAASDRITLRILADRWNAKREGRDQPSYKDIETVIKTSAVAPGRGLGQRDAAG